MSETGRNVEVTAPAGEGAAGTNTADRGAAAVELDDEAIGEAISRLGEPGRSVLAALLGRVRELEGEVEDLRDGAGGQDVLDGLAGRVDRLEGAVEGWGGGGLEDLADRVERLEGEVETLRNTVEDARI